jgi:NitT/TauT family transport system ATP-binding protein
MGMLASATVPAIELRDVRRTFDLADGRKITAVNGATLTVLPGEFVCAVGPSGHGKSTLLNLIAGFLEPSSGSVLAHGTKVVGPGPDRGVVFQRDTLFNWMRVVDNVEFGLKARGLPAGQRRQVSSRLLKTVGLAKFAKAWPKQLSGGMRRRTAIAAVFANEPKVLLMDEPFTGLDYARRAVLHDLVLELWQRAGNTVFCVTHDLDEALALATRIVVVINGEITHEAKLDIPYPRGPSVLTSPEVNAVRLDILKRLQHAVRDIKGDNG